MWYYIVTLAFYWFLFAEHTFSHLFMFNLPILCLKWVSCGQYRVKSCGKIYFANLCLIIGVSRLFTVNIINILGLKSVTFFLFFLFFIYLFFTFLPMDYLNTFLESHFYLSILFWVYLSLCIVLLQFSRYYIIYISYCRKWC